MIRVNGVQLQQAIRAAQQERDLAAQRFTPSLTAFPNENKPKPEEVSKTFEDSERRVAKLQEAQAMYNLRVRVRVNGEHISLLEAIKRVGGAGRLEKMWRSASAEQVDRYAIREQTRDANAVVAQRQITYDRANENRKVSSKKAASLRAAISLGNAQEVDLDIDLPADWLTV